MYVALVFLILAAPFAALAEEDPKWMECGYVSGMAGWLYQRARVDELPEDRLHIDDSMRTPEEHAFVLQMKHEAYHDLSALKARVESACAKKERL